MKRILNTTVLLSFFMGATVLASVAATEQESHHPSNMQAATTTSSSGMMMQRGAGMNQKPCMNAPSSDSKSQKMRMMERVMGSGMSGTMGGASRHGMMQGSHMGMMGGGDMHGMMQGGHMGMMAQGMMLMSYLDRADELGLSAEQVNQLKAIHVECRKDNIRNAAEAKIARLELSALLSDNSWTLKDAEPLVRKAQALKGDIQVRHLKAVSDARKVLTAEQLQQAGADGSAENLESLFQ